MTEVVYEVRDLVRTYGARRAVDGISFTAEAGQCVGLLGPNGAGKSTTIEVMEGIALPTSGTVRYRGRPLDESFRQVVGIMFQSTALPDFIRVHEVLEMFSNLYHGRTDVSVLIERCGVGDFLNQATNQLSGGQRQRLLLAVALINNPEIIFLDEPTTGLDPSARQRLWEVITESKREGKTVVLTTHYMEEAYRLCDSIILMNHGVIVAQGSPEQLLAEQFNTTILVLPDQATEGVDFWAEQLSAHQDLVLLEADKGELHFECSDVNSALRLMFELGIDLTHLQIRKKNLNDLFFKLTSH